MTFIGWAQIALFCLLIVALVRPLGGYMTRLFAGERTCSRPSWPGRARALPARRRGRAAGAALGRPTRWPCCCSTSRACSCSMRMQRLQHVLPLNPQGMRAVAPDLAFNTAVSFTTNTNWQCYGGESTMSYLVQMAGLTVHNFVSAATGIALALALIRGFTRAGAGDDRQLLGRSRPLHALRAAADLVRPGAVLRLAGRAAEPRRLRRPPPRSKAASRRSRQGPVASQEAIKMLGTNGGGFFNANSAHPTRTRRRSPTSCRSCRSSPSAPALTTSSAAWPATSARAGRSSPPWACSSWPASCVAYWAEAARQPAARRAGRRPARAATWRARRSASASPPRRSSP